MPYKKILIALIVLLFLTVGAFLAYNFYFNKNEEPPKEEPETKELALPSDLEQVSEEPVLAPTIDEDRVKYYLRNNGNVYQSYFNGNNKTPVSQVNLTDLFKAAWSRNKDKIITFFQDPETMVTEKYYYNYNNQKAIKLDKNIRSVAWAPHTDKIAYQYYDPSVGPETSISIANPDGSSWKNVLKTRMENLIVKWPNRSNLVLQTRASGKAQSVVYQVDIDSGQLTKVKQGYGLTTLWSPFGNKILLSETNTEGKNLKLKMANLDQEIVKELDIQTLPEKCVWSQDNRTIFCAVPSEIPNNAVLPDDYWQDKLFFKNSVWKINLDTGRAAQILEEVNLDLSQLFLSETESHLFFVDRKDDSLYSLEL